jgi:hypothetical protein
MDCTTVANRKKIVLYCYHKAAQLEALWPSNLPEAVIQASIDKFANSIDLGPCPINGASLSSKAHLYLHLDVQGHACNRKKSYHQRAKSADICIEGIHFFRNLKEVSIIACQSELSVLLMS